MMVSS
jgi:hypothetical protein